MLLILVSSSVGAWLYGLSLLDEGPRALNASQRITSIVSLTRYALVSADTSFRVDLILTLARSEGLLIIPKEKDDTVVPVPSSRLNELILENLRRALGSHTEMARSVNGTRGLWVSFQIEGDEYWLRAERGEPTPRLGANWAIWFGGMLLLCLVFTVLITGRITGPLETLSKFARTLGSGRLPEPLPIEGPKEIQQVNESFNVMVTDLKRLASDRELLLAGVSHDLRTPMTRLRLEVEMASLDESTKEDMCSDLDQMENILKQFMAYTRESKTEVEVVNISNALRQVIHATRIEEQPDVECHVSIDEGLEVRANPTDLMRAIQNIIVNASKYGRSQDGKLRLNIRLKQLKRRNAAGLLISDDGPGVPESEFERLLRPFERGEKARTNTSGSGLGLSIVDRVAKAGGGQVTLSQNIPNGLRVHMVLPLVPSGSVSRQKV